MSNFVQAVMSSITFSNDNSHSPLFTLPSKLTLLSRSRLALVIKSFKSSSRTFQSIFSNNSLKSADSMYPLLSESKTRKACIMSSSLSSGVFCCSIRLMYSSKFSFPSPVIRQGAFFKVFISTKCRMCIVPQTYSKVSTDCTYAQTVTGVFIHFLSSNRRYYTYHRNRPWKSSVVGLLR